MISSTEIRPSAPMIHHKVPGASLRYTPTGSVRALRPRLISAIISGRPTSRVASR